MRLGRVAGFGLVLAGAAAVAVGWAAHARPTAPYGGRPRPVDDALRAALRVRGEDARSRGFRGEEEREEERVALGPARWHREFTLAAGECLSVTVAAAGCGDLEGLRLETRPSEPHAPGEGWSGVRLSSHPSPQQPQTAEVCAWAAPREVRALSQISSAYRCTGADATVIVATRRGAASAIAGPAALRGAWSLEASRQEDAADAARAWAEAHALPSEPRFGPVEVAPDSATPLAPAASLAACREAYRLAVGSVAEGFVAPHLRAEGCPPEEAHAPLPRGSAVNLTTGDRRVLAIVEPGAFGAAAVIVTLTRLDRGPRFAPPVAVITATERQTLEDARSGEGFVFDHRVEPAAGLVRYEVARGDRGTYRIEVRPAGGPGGALAEASEAPFAGAVELSAEVVAWQRACASGDGEACRALGLAHRVGEGGAAVDLGRSDRAFAQGCDAGDEESCAYHASEWIAARVRPDERGPGDDLAEASCRRGGALSCALLGDRYRLGLAESDGSAASATDAYRRACELGLESGCVNQRLMAELHIR